MKWKISSNITKI